MQEMITKMQAQMQKQGDVWTVYGRSKSHDNTPFSKRAQSTLWFQKHGTPKSLYLYLKYLNGVIVDAGLLCVQAWFVVNFFFSLPL